MAQKAEPGRRPAEGRQAKAAAVQGAAHGLPGAGGLAEPGTAWALWPTFLRRTLAEEEMALRRAPLSRAE